MIKGRLVVFDGEVVMRFTIPDQIIGDFMLGQKGIGGNRFALNVDGLQKRYGGLDFVGAFNLLVGYRQRSYFFWV